MRHIALLMLLTGIVTTTAHADVPVEKWHVWYASFKKVERKADFAAFWVPVSDGTYQFTTAINLSGPGADPNAKITADVTVTRHGQILDVGWETHDAGKSWYVKARDPLTITPANKFEGHLDGGDTLYGQKE
jgi:hypothetical protein